MKAAKVDVWGLGELEKFFNSVELPGSSVRIDECTVVDDVKLFLQVELATARAHNGEYRYEPYLNRLQLLKNALS